MEQYVTLAHSMEKEHFVSFAYFWSGCHRIYGHSHISGKFILRN